MEPSARSNLITIYKLCDGQPLSSFLIFQIRKSLRPNLSNLKLKIYATSQINFMPINR